MKEVRAATAILPFASEEPTDFFFKRALELLRGEDELGLLLHYLQRGYHITGGVLRDRRYWKGTPPELMFLARCVVGPKPFDTAHETIADEWWNNPAWKRHNELVSVLLYQHEFSSPYRMGGQVTFAPIVTRLAQALIGNRHDYLPALGLAARRAWVEGCLPGWTKSSL